MMRWSAWLKKELHRLGLNMSDLHHLAKVNYVTVWSWLRRDRQPHPFMRQRVEAALAGFERTAKKLRRRK